MATALDVDQMGVQFLRAADCVTGAGGEGGALSIVLHVVGRPAPQGSKCSFGRGRMVEQSKYVAPWREAVKYAALQAWQGKAPMDGPLTGAITFYIARPKKSKYAHPATAPDLSKLLRSTEDALKDAGVISDDSRIVQYTRLEKRYVTGLLQPGAYIEIGEL